MPHSLIVTGARVFLYINGKKVGKVTSFMWKSTTDYKEINGLDSAEPYELASEITRVVGQVGLLRLAGDGGIEGLGITAQFEDLTRQKYVTIALVDRVTQTLLFRADQCVIVDQQWSVQVKNRLEGMMSFKGITWNNEFVRGNN